MSSETEYENDTQTSATAADGPTKSDWRKFLVGIAIGCAAIGAVVFAILLIGNRLPDLTEEDYQAATARWEASGIEDYEMEIEITGNRAGIVKVTVEDGVVTSMTRDGQTPRERRTWQVWSVDGQFHMIRQDLDGLPPPEETPSGPGSSRTVLRAKFDPQYGYPVAFRHLSYGFGPEFGWKVTRFEPVEE